MYIRHGLDERNRSGLFRGSMDPHAYFADIRIRGSIYIIISYRRDEHIFMIPQDLHYNLTQAVKGIRPLS